jgi:hypothetical protein
VDVVGVVLRRSYTLHSNRERTNQGTRRMYPRCTSLRLLVQFWRFCLIVKSIT